MNPNETLSSHDRLALYGFGLFETLLITEKGPLLFELHWNRLGKGADVLRLELPDKHYILNQLQEFIEQTPKLYPYALRLTLSGGAPDTKLPSQLMFHRRLIPYTASQYARGIQLHVLSTPRNEFSPLISIKSTNYLENILAKEIAKSNGADEGLWLNTKGYLCEGTMSNLFFLKNQELFTPSLLSGCLPGTRRQLLLSIARSLHIPTHEGFYPLSELLLADEIFMTNALMGVMPVRQIDNFPFPLAEKSMTGILESEYKNLIDNQSRF